MDWYDRNGVPITMDEYMRLCETIDMNEYKRIDLTEVGPYIVSTVWLGLDHSFCEGPPLIFETMVFSNAEWRDTTSVGLQDIDTRRYSTEEEARQGHEETVLLVRATTQEIPNQKEETT